MRVLRSQQKFCFTFLESELIDEAVNESEDFDELCVFVNDVLEANVIKQLHQ
jgi:hypothetical protein